MILTINGISVVAPAVSMAFSITGNNNNGARDTGTVVGTTCNTDWLSIPCATNTLSPTAQSAAPTVCVDRICGMVFNSVTLGAADAATAAAPVNSKYYSRNSDNHILTLPIFWAP